MCKDCFDCKFNTVNSKECGECIGEYKFNLGFPNQEGYDKWHKEKPKFELKDQIEVK